MKNNNLVSAPTMNQDTLLNPSSNDGKTHINVHYNCGHEKLGRQLSAYHVAQFTHFYFGPFKCIEGLLWYVRTGAVDDVYRELTGSQAKAYYREQVKNKKVKTYEVEHEEALIVSACRAKMDRHPAIAEMFVKSTLPFDMYYLHGPGQVPVRPKDATPYLNALTILREAMQNEVALPELSNEQYAEMRIVK